MSKQIDEQTMKFSISISQYCYETLNLGNIKNRSRYIERLLLNGLDSEIFGNTTLKGKLAESISKSRILQDKIQNLNSQIEKLKKIKKEDIQWDRTQ